MVDKRNSCHVAFFRLPVKKNTPLVLFASVAALVSAVLVLNSCAPRGQAESVAFRQGPSVREILERVMPEAMADGIVKIALLVNEKDGSNTWQFIEAGVAEGRSMGFTVDAFAMDAEANAERFRQLAQGIAMADYDGLIFVNGPMGFTYDIQAHRRQGHQNRDLRGPSLQGW